MRIKSKYYKISTLKLNINLLNYKTVICIIRNFLNYLFLLFKMMANALKHNVKNIPEQTNFISAPESANTSDIIPKIIPMIHKTILILFFCILKPPPIFFY